MLACSICNTSCLYLIARLCRLNRDHFFDPGSNRLRWLYWNYGEVLVPAAGRHERLPKEVQPFSAHSRCHQQQPPRRPIPDDLCQRKPKLRLEADSRLRRVRGGLDQPEAAERTPASGLFSSRCRFVVPVCPGNFSELM